MLLKIVQAGDPVLRQMARRLTPDEIRSDGIQAFIGLMRETMQDAPGVGLAAPQVGESIQIVVVEDRAELQTRLTTQQLAERERQPLDFHVLINPELSIEDATPVTFFEGCLSVAELHSLVPRAHTVRVRALNERAEPVEIVAAGWYARILQHEIDHLHGVLCIDHMQSRSLTTVRNFDRHWAGKSTVEIQQILGIRPTGTVASAARSILQRLLADLPDEAAVPVRDVRQAWQEISQQLEEGQ